MPHFLTVTQNAKILNKGPQEVKQKQKAKPVFTKKENATLAQ